MSRPTQKEKPGAARPAKDPAQSTVNVLMAGVGGQGVLLASETLAIAALTEGLQAKQSEVHGVAQRGGSVVSHVRLGARVHSPLIRCGEVDALYAGEKLEALRYAHYVKPGGLVVMDDREIKPIQLPDEAEMPYPTGIFEFLRGTGLEVLLIPALETALELGEKRCANVVLLGALSVRLQLTEQSWHTAIRRRFPEKIVDLNLRAFASGRELAISLRSRN
jgi:indolepyruvate ferredoxin oxidoreductase beta subunit